MISGPPPSLGNAYPAPRRPRLRLPP